MVTTGSDQSFRTLMDKLPKKEIHSQMPIVTPFSRHYFNQFEEQARRDMPSTNNGSGGNGNNNNSNDSSHGNQYMSRNDSQQGSHHHNHNNLHSQPGGAQYQSNQMSIFYLRFSLSCLAISYISSAPTSLLF